MVHFIAATSLRPLTPLLRECSDMISEPKGARGEHRVSFKKEWDGNFHISQSIGERRLRYSPLSSVVYFSFSPKMELDLFILFDMALLILLIHEVDSGKPEVIYSGE